MMHECPRCHFVQPQDRYCANCGLDIENFKPIPKPLYLKILQNTGLQVTLAILIVIGLGSWIYLSQRQAIEEKLAATLNLSNSPDQPATEAVTPPPAETAPTAEMDTDPQGGLTSLENAPAALAPAAGGAPTPRRPTSLNVQFVEMSRLYLNQLAGENQVVDETATTRSIVLTTQPTVSALKEKDPGLDALPASDTQTIRPGRSINLDFMHMSGGPNDVVGMEITINPSNITEQSMELAVNGTMAIKGQDGSVSNLGFEGKYNIPVNASLMIAGMLPHQSVRAEDQEVFSSTPLVILSSPDFLNNTSEFVVIIQPK